MWLELLLALVLGLVIYRFVSQDKEETLPLEDGWWGPGSKSSTREDESIRPFKVETSDEEIEVRRPFSGSSKSREVALLGSALMWMKAGAGKNLGTYLSVTLYLSSLLLKQETGYSLERC